MTDITRAIDAPRESRIVGTRDPEAVQDAIGNAMRAYWDCLDQKKRHSFHRQRNSGSQVRCTSRDDDRRTQDSEPTG
jgi:hypothetical protein